MPKLKHLLISLIASASLFVIFSSSTHAASFTVAAGNDENTDNSSCSLTEAITNINAQSTDEPDCVPTGAYGTDDTINLPAGTITLTDNLAEITEDIIIQGQARDSSIIDGDSNQYSGVLATNEQLNSFTIQDLTIQDMSPGGLYVCAAEVYVENILVDNSELGAAFVCNDGNDQVREVNISDSEFNNNVSDDNGGLSGLFIQIDSNCSADIEVNISRVKTNNNSGSDNSFSGLAIYSGQECGGAISEQITIEDVESSGNTAYSIAGIGVVMQGNDNSVVSISHTTASGNVLDGPLELEAGSATSGILVSSAETVVIENSTVVNNIADPDVGSDSVGVGISVFGIGKLTNTTVSNATLANNIINNPGNIAPNPTFSGLGLFSTVDFSTIYTGTITNLVAFDNLLGSEVATCTQEIDFGMGPTQLPLISGGGNVVGDDSCQASFTQPTDLNNVSGLGSTLSALADNGGYVPTMALKQGSPAIDSGITIPTLTTDARGEVRPQGNAYDSGAYESPYTRSEDEADSSTDSLASTGQNIRLAGIFAAILLALGLMLHLRRQYV